MPVADGRVDEPDLSHRRRIRKSTSPYCTGGAVLDADLGDRRPRPRRTTAFISFITSMMQTCVSASTRLPTSTNGGAPARARGRPSRPSGASPRRARRAARPADDSSLRPVSARRAVEPEGEARRLELELVVAATRRSTRRISCTSSGVRSGRRSPASPRKVAAIAASGSAREPRGCRFWRLHTVSARLWRSKSSPRRRSPTRGPARGRSAARRARPSSASRSTSSGSRQSRPRAPVDLAIDVAPSVGRRRTRPPSRRPRCAGSRASPSRRGTSPASPRRRRPSRRARSSRRSRSTTGRR